MKRIAISIAAMLALLTACSSPAATTTPVPPPTSTVAPLTTGSTLDAAQSGIAATAAAIGSTTPTSESAAVGTQSALATGGSIAVLPAPTTGAPMTATSAATPSALNGALAANQMNPCSLVSKDDVQAALGVAVQDPTVSTSSSGAVVCQFVATTNNAISAGIALYQGAAMSDAANQLTQGQMITGLGDAASLTAQGLYVKAGNTILIVTVALGSQTSQVNAAEQALAQKAILNMTVF